MNSKERYQHLEYIRDSLYSDSKHWCSESPASSFINVLKQLKCIRDDGYIHQISDFCDYTVKIFIAFPDNFLFLPEEFRDEKWLPFLRDLGMKQTLSKEEFLLFCQETAGGKINTVKECSRILLDYLFSQDYNDCFLRKVSEIPFVFQAPLAKLSWVVPAVFPIDQMVKLNGSASRSRASLLWTLKPIVKLPANLFKVTATNLGITVNPSRTDVIMNISNICKNSQYAQPSLFQTYPQNLVCPKDKDSLLKIMTANLTYLNRKYKETGSKITGSSLSELQALPCIPVYKTTEHGANGSAVVLVKPFQVVCAYWDKDAVRQFHPFLHCLPDELKSLSILLEQIGVKISLELCHIQVVLEKAYEASGDSVLDINTEKCVKLAIQMLERFLKSPQDSKVLSPLYLPDSENKLKPSKSLLYGDTYDYRGILELDLKDVPYFHFNIKLAEYKCNIVNFCQLLPESVRPIGLSTVCEQRMIDVPQRTENSDVALQLLETMKIPDIPTGIASFISIYTSTNEKSEPILREKIIHYIDVLDVITVSNLKIQIFLTESGVSIGEMTRSSWYIPGDEKSVLYLDSDLIHPVGDHDTAYLLHVSNHMCSLLCQLVEANATYDQENISDVIKSCLKATSAKEIQRLLLYHGVNVESGNEMRSMNKKLGVEVPKCWHHRLDQDIDNVFNPMEYVGYEDKEGHIIIAQIVHISSDAHEMEKTYRIYMRDDDTDGEIVSFLSLYKFLVCPKKSEEIDQVQSGEGDIVPFHQDDDMTNLRASWLKEDLLDAKKKVVVQLKGIWKLTQDLRNKAIRRLYLKWHPDKNENPEEAEKIFKFIMKQIEHLEKEDSLDNPEWDAAAERESFQRTREEKYNYHSKYFNFDSWNNTAHNHSSSSDFEHTFFDYDGSMSLSKPKKPSTSDYFPFDKQEDGKNPQEGRRWVRQANNEFKILLLNYEQASLCSGYGYVCFLAHQVAEKALKGGVYALCGMDGRSMVDHNLSRPAYALQTALPERTKGLAQHCITLESYYLDTRYPDRWPDHSDTPSELYSQDCACQAKDHAKAVLDTVKSIMQ